jgi:Transcriptional regulator, AbiEi antitoxin
MATRSDHEREAGRETLQAEAFAATPRRSSEPGRKTLQAEAFAATPHLDQALVDLALSRYGVFALSELEQLGISRTGVRTRTARGRLHRVHQGVYSIVPTAMLTQDGRWLAAALACGPGAALSIRDATALYGLRGNGRHLIDVTVPGRSHRSRPGIELHRSTTLRPEDVVIVRGIPVTSVARTVLDIAGVIPMDQLELVLEQAEVQGVLDERALREQIAHNHTRVGASRLATRNGSWWRRTGGNSTGHGRRSNATPATISA